MAALRRAMKLLDDAGHDSGPITDATLHARDDLERLGPIVEQYRHLPRSPAEQELAVKFANQFDIARGRVQRAAGELQDASRRSVLGNQDAVEPPFRSADLRIEAAKAELERTQALVPAPAPE